MPAHRAWPVLWRGGCLLRDLLCRCMLGLGQCGRGGRPVAVGGPRICAPAWWLPLPACRHCISPSAHACGTCATLLQVSRSLAACQGALLLVDASQGVQVRKLAAGMRAMAGSARQARFCRPAAGAPPCLRTLSALPAAAPLPPLLPWPVQAQTVANFYLAFEQDLSIVPVLNKIDMDSADPQARRCTPVNPPETPRKGLMNHAVPCLGRRRGVAAALAMCPPRRAALPRLLCKERRSSSCVCDVWHQPAPPALFRGWPSSCV